MGCGEQVTDWHYFIQSSFALRSLHFELSRISLSVCLDFLLYYLFFASVFNHRPCPKVHSSPVHDFLIHPHSPEGFARNTTSTAWGK